MMRLRQLPTGTLVDRIVEAQLQPRMFAIGAEGFEIRMTGIEDRQHMRDARLAMIRQFIDAANGEQERQTLRAGHDRGHS
jgi:hypothetical protein